MHVLGFMSFVVYAFLFSCGFVFFGFLGLTPPVSGGPQPTDSRPGNKPALWAVRSTGMLGATPGSAWLEHTLRLRSPSGPRAASGPVAPYWNKEGWLPRCSRAPHDRWLVANWPWCGALASRMWRMGLLSALVFMGFRILSWSFVLSSWFWVVCFGGLSSAASDT
jgi:hypothetical protein